jgi:SagB-type dehydrogenase family enzyme
MESGQFQIIGTMRNTLAFPVKCTWMLKNRFWLGIILILISLVGCQKQPIPPVGEDGSILTLPTPLYDSQTSIEQALQARRSVRSFNPAPLSLAEVSQLLWAAQGITHPGGLRTAPSAGALYPLDIYLIVGNVLDLPAGVYRYKPQDHELIQNSEGDIRQNLFEAALQQSAVKDAAIVLVISAVYERTTVKYGQRGIQYVHTEVGHAAQNVYLQVESLGLGTVYIGAFHEEEIKAVLQMSEEETPLGLMPVGRKFPSDSEIP